MQSVGTVINKITTLFDSALSGTTVSAGITIPTHVDKIVISSKRDKAIWLCDESGNKQILLPIRSDVTEQIYAEFRLGGCTIKLQGDATATEEVYVVAFHGV